MVIRESRKFEAPPFSSNRKHFKNRIKINNTTTDRDKSKRGNRHAGCNLQAKLKDSESERFLEENPETHKVNRGHPGPRLHRQLTHSVRTKPAPPICIEVSISQSKLGREGIAEHGMRERKVLPRNVGHHPLVRSTRQPTLESPFGGGTAVLHEQLINATYSIEQNSLQEVA